MIRYCTGAVAAGAALAAFAASPAVAHHSYVMFDQTKVATVKGTIAKVDWGDPHVYLWLYVLNDKGSHDVYAMESASINGLARRGWTRDTVKVGEKVTIDYHPLKDGRHGGSLMSVTHADGTVTDAGSFAPRRPSAP